MSELRKELVTAEKGEQPLIKGGTAYLMILNAVETQHGLIHGQLHARGEHCAIGSYFDVNPKTSMPTSLIDEVAAVNDSMPTLTKRQRKLRMLRWLRWRLARVGMPGYERYGCATAPKK